MIYGTIWNGSVSYGTVWHAAISPEPDPGVLMINPFLIRHVPPPPVFPIFYLQIPNLNSGSKSSCFSVLMIYVSWAMLMENTIPILR